MMPMDNDWVNDDDVDDDDDADDDGDGDDDNKETGDDELVLSGLNPPMCGTLYRQRSLIGLLSVYLNSSLTILYTL